MQKMGKQGATPMWKALSVQVVYFNLFALVWFNGKLVAI